MKLICSSSPSPIFLLALLLVTIGPAFSQRQLISSKDYLSAVYARPDGVPANERMRRIETIQETMDSGTVIKTSTIVEEFAPPGRTRRFEKALENGKTSETESILVDRILYTRKDDGAWWKDDLRNDSQTYGVGSDAGGACAQYAVENVVVDGTPVKLFTELIVTGGKELKFFESRTWIASDGLRYRFESSKGQLSPRVETWRSVSIYDYEAKVKIDAPVK